MDETGVEITLAASGGLRYKVRCRSGTCRAKQAVLRRRSGRERKASYAWLGNVSLGNALLGILGHVGLNIMRWSWVFGLVPVMAVSCSKSPSSQQAATEQVAGEPPAVSAPAAPVGESPAVDGTMDGKIDGGKVEEKTGPLAIGERAPDFLLQDQAGVDRSLVELLAGGKVALVFYRSADW